MRRSTALVAAGAAAAAVALAAVVVYGGESPAPTGGADCTKGVWVKATGYSTKERNSLSVNLSGRVQQEEFKTDAVLAMPIPHDNKRHLWVWSVGSTEEDASASKQGFITCDKNGNATRAPRPQPSAPARSSTAPEPTSEAPSPTKKPSTRKPSPTRSPATPEPSVPSTSPTPTLSETPEPTVTETVEPSPSETPTSSAPSTPATSSAPAAPSSSPTLN